MESELARFQNALAIAKEARQKAKDEARQKAKDEASRLADERVSSLLELGTCKDELSAIRAEALKEKKAMEEAYKEGFNVIFNYGRSMMFQGCIL